jgi:hypothetical protein
VAFAVGCSGNPDARLAPHDPPTALSQTVTLQQVAEPRIRSDVALPSSDFTAYIEGERVRVRIPSNWRELPGSNAVTFAPDGAYGDAGVKSVFTHGLAMGLARNDKRSLQVTTDDFIESYVLVDHSADSRFLYDTVTMADRPGLHAVLATVSEATRAPERTEIFTTLLDDETLFYVLAVVPRDSAPMYTATFRRIVDSIEIMDCDAARSPGDAPETPRPSGCREDRGRAAPRPR